MITVKGPYVLKLEMMFRMLFNYLTGIHGDVLVIFFIEIFRHEFTIKLEHSEMSE